ncbi:unnamed protein product [Cunninghamella blakesleeana]
MNDLTIYNKLEELSVKYMEKNNIKRLGFAIAITWASYSLTSKLYNAFFGPLSHIPGPLYAKLFKIPLALTDFPRGTRFRRSRALHEKYGTIVQVYPNVVSVSDKDMIKQILVKDDLQKAPFYDKLQDDGNQTLFNTRDFDFHKQRRRILSPAFSMKYLYSLEPFITSCTEDLVNKIDKEIIETKDEESYGTVDIWSLLARLAFDIIGEVAYNESFNLVNDNDHFIPLSVSRGMRFSTKLIIYPFLKTLIKIFGINRDEKFEKFMVDIIMRRLESKERRTDILQILIDTQNSTEQEDRLTVRAIIAEVILFLIAGAETTSNSTGFAIIELLRHPEKLILLQQEIDAIPLEPGQSFYTQDQLKKLPYLNAVINETMRLNPIASNGLQRITNRDMLLVGKVFIPKNTVLICNMNHSHVNPEYWENPNDFIPERWLEGANPPPCLDAYYPFSAGSRNCIGKQFALMEMRLSIATLVKHYDFKAIPAELEAAKDLRQFITLTVEKNSFQIKLKPRKF